MRLYDLLLVCEPTPVVALNRAIALAEVEGAQVALEVVDQLDLQTYYLFHAVRADLLMRLGRTTDADCAYEAAIARCDNLIEREFLVRRRSDLRSS